MKKKQFTKKHFLQEALEVLSKDGAAGLKIDPLCKQLGVSKGSFYWHFRNRKDFEDSLVNFWFEEYTKSIGERVLKLEGDPVLKLSFLAKSIVSNDETRYELAIRSWAAQNDELARAVAKADRFRFKVISGLFSEMGFSGAELRVRAKTFQCYYSLELGLFNRESKRVRLEDLQYRIKLLTRK